MKSFAARSFRLLEPVLRPNHESRRETTAALRAARMRTFPEWYLAQTLITSAAAGVVAAFLVLVVLVATLPHVPIWASIALAPLGGAFVASFVRLGFLVYPRIRANSRRESIDTEYQSAVVLCYALARGGMPAMDIFRTVAAEKETYGEICTEFECVVRDVEMFGYDMVKAIQGAAATTPSLLLKGFFEGLVSILNSGADPRDYFRRQAEQQLANAEVRMQEDLATADMLAEMYVSSLLVLPLLVLVVLSGLSALGNGQERYIPPVVYGLIPVGTLFYVVLLEVMMPATNAQPPRAKPLPRADFGIDTIPTIAARGTLAAGADEAIAKLPLGLRVRHRWDALRRELLARPSDALNYSALPAIGILAAGALALLFAGADGYTIQSLGMILLLVAIAVALLPVAICHEIRLAHARRIERALPDMLSKLAGFNERGIGLLQSFQIIARSSSGPLAKEMQTLDRDVQVNGSLQGAVRRLRERVRTLRMSKIGVLIERASRSTSSLKEVLDIAAQDETRTQTLVARKRQTMMSYVLVIYIVFGVFLYVAYMTASLFYGGDAGFTIATNGGGASESTMSSSLAPDAARILFFHAVVLQGIASGLVAGRLGEGHVLSGVKHAIILGGLATVVFAAGVM